MYFGSLKEKSSNFRLKKKKKEDLSFLQLSNIKMGQICVQEFQKTPEVFEWILSF